MTRNTITLPRSVVEQALEAWEQARGALAYVAVGNAPSNPNLARSTCSQAVWVLDNAEPALRAALEQKCPCGATQQSQIDECAYANCVIVEPLRFSSAWKLVPTSMTDKMAAADKELRHAVPWVRWEAILAAAPQPPRQPLTDQVIQPLTDQVIQPLTDQVIQELADEGVFHANVFEIVRRIEEEHGIFKLRAQGIGGEK